MSGCKLLVKRMISLNSKRESSNEGEFNEDLLERYRWRALEAWRAWSRGEVLTFTAEKLEAAKDCDLQDSHNLKRRHRLSGAYIPRTLWGG